ncbi:LysR family transcriptional regulator [Rubellimicrobium roseum]|uniref:LysR family transcriptional regulator n=1 Tax=Rubellimicrobium roseum TaxID=687525 RepID=UPI001C3F48C8
MTSLAVFKAAARHDSFTPAASELNVTPGAASRQIRSLETELGVALFPRHNWGVLLTASGEELFQVLAQGYARTSEVVRAIRRSDTARRVTVASSDVFGSMWLLPRMSDFWRHRPEIKVDRLISGNTLDFRRADVDLRALRERRLARRDGAVPVRCPRLPGVQPGLRVGSPGHQGPGSQGVADSGSRLGGAGLAPVSPRTPSPAAAVAVARAKARAPAQAFGKRYSEFMAPPGCFTRRERAGTPDRRGCPRAGARG